MNKKMFDWTTEKLLKYLDEGGNPFAKDESESPQLVPAEELAEDAVTLDEIATELPRYGVLPDGAAETTTLFVMHAHTHDAARISPLLAIMSPEPGCGKTTLLSVLSKLTPDPLFITDSTPAGLYRTISARKRTLLFDEAHTAVGSNNALQRLLNAGHCVESAAVLRADGEFVVWCPKAIALIGELPATLRDRSLRIYLNRKRPHEDVAPLDVAAIARLKELKSRAERWAAQHLDQLAAANPVMPDAITNRTRDNWRPLIAIADAAGGRWPELARSLAVKAAAEDESHVSPGIALLRDIRQIFEGADRLTTADLLHALNSNEDMPWREWNRTRPLTAIQLAQMLRPFGIHPKTIRIGADTAKGYLLSDFQDDFQRYL